MQRLKYEKFNNSNDIITIDLHKRKDSLIIIFRDMNTDRTVSMLETIW